MTKPLSREKVSWFLHNAPDSAKIYFITMLEKLKAGDFDADEPAFDVDWLINSFSQRILYLQGLNKARKSNDPKYFEAETIIRELSNQIVIIKQKLKKEPEVAKIEFGGKVCSIQINRVDQYQHGVGNKNLIDADELMDWCDNNVQSVNGVTDRNFIEHDKLERFIRSKLPAKEEDLKPCPFCGEKEELVYAEDLDDDGGDCFYVECDNCKVRGQYKKTKQEAIAEWNTWAEK